MKQFFLVPLFFAAFAAAHAGLIKPERTCPQVAVPNNKPVDVLPIEARLEIESPAVELEPPAPRANSTTPSSRVRRAAPARRPSAAPLAAPRQAQASALASPTTSPPSQSVFRSIRVAAQLKLAQYWDRLGAKAPKGSGAAIAGFVLGIVGLVFTLSVVGVVLGLPLNIIGLFLSAFNSKERFGIAGLVLNIIGVVLGLIVLPLLLL